MKWIKDLKFDYKDEPIRFPPERARLFPPKEYRAMRELAADLSLSHSSSAKIFYRQAWYMEYFEDDCPYQQGVLHYYPTYQDLTMPELRGYFTWRTRLRHGTLEKTSLTYAYLYLYELLHQIGSKTKEEGLERLIWFRDAYGELDPRILHYASLWIVDYAVYYNVSPEMIRNFIHRDFDEALDILSRCDTVDDEALFPAILQLSSYRLERSKGYKQYPEELAKAICTGYRKLNDWYARRYDRPYTRRLYNKPVSMWYIPFHSAVFYHQKQFDHYEYRVSPTQRYYCEGNEWRMEQDYAAPERSQELGVFVRAADRLVREAYGVKAPLKPGTETKTMVKLLTETIAEQKKAPAARVEFDLRKLSGIRKRSDAVGQRLMTEEERYVEPEPEPPVAPEERGPASDCILSGNELRFMQILLYGGDLQRFLSQGHLMASLLAETVNERLYDEFADTVVEFEGNTPVLVADYVDDLKGMIPS
ncbi:MAG: TerB N-terminal domain-containing protein [Clostridiales bacterium]|nr:TerB N-terminal domain-containing protein [Clostridiales bacterium]